MANKVLTMPKDGRGLVVGQTGTGKTTLSRVLLQDKLNLLVIDPKGEFETDQPFQVITDIGKLAGVAEKVHTKKRQEAIIYRPPINALEDMEEINRVFQYAFARGNTFVYVDEVTGVVKSAQSYPYALRSILTQGRSKNVGILNATQRPAYIPTFLLSESGYFWKFFLSAEQDVDRIGGYMGVPRKGLDAFALHGNQYSFYYYNQLERKPAREYVLKVSTERI